MELLLFLEKDKPLPDNTTPILSEFKEKYPNQNGGLLCEDVIKFAKRFNKYCILLHNEEQIFTGNTDFLITDENEQHTYYIHVNYERQKFEKYDDYLHSNYSNNCTLYSAVAAAIRPYRSGKQTLEILNKITHEQWVEISKHYFNRGEEWFKKSKHSENSSELIEVKQQPKIIHENSSNELTNKTISPKNKFDQSNDAAKYSELIDKSNNSTDLQTKFSEICSEELTNLTDSQTKFSEVSSDNSLNTFVFKPKFKTNLIELLN